MKRKRCWTLVALGAAALAAGCRSGGGIDRADRAPGAAYAWRSVATHFSQDCRATAATVSGAPAAFVRGTKASLVDLRESCRMYLDNTYSAK